MATSVTELDAMLDTLEAGLPQMIEDHPHVADFCMTFIAAADAIEAQAGTADLAHVRTRVDGMLAQHGSTKPPGQQVRARSG